ncbi:sacsin N-terminal ATP-binding-like domain-containing protein [Nonomuraea montanisoli]|uniref:sacsin N-terminal ATP-binding-like domain-containing protein n=1 Tax=Nonomuraea montanisoli TaxID=2741721 RepID=UPI0038B23D38
MLREWEATQTWQPDLQLRSATFSSARDYSGRFLLELLQNGHDAHPSDRSDGCIRILLDASEGSYGTLYVANGGIPFTWPRVEAICKFALTEKTVGEGIGNKGIGFRSIPEITDAPEIYSARASGLGPLRLDGYCFRFATECDVSGHRKPSNLRVRGFLRFRLCLRLVAASGVDGQLAQKLSGDRIDDADVQPRGSSLHQLLKDARPRPRPKPVIGGGPRPVARRADPATGYQYGTATSRH